MITTSSWSKLASSTSSAPLQVHRGGGNPLNIVPLHSLNILYYYLLIPPALLITILFHVCPRSLVSFRVEGGGNWAYNFRRYKGHSVIKVEIIWKWCNDFSFYDTVHWPRQAQLAGGTLYLQGPPCYPGRNHVKTIQWFLFVWHSTLTSSGAAFWWKIRLSNLRNHLFVPKKRNKSAT